MENSKTKNDIVTVFDITEPHWFGKHNISQSDVVCWDWIVCRVCVVRDGESLY